TNQAQYCWQTEAMLDENRTLGEGADCRIIRIAQKLDTHAFALGEIVDDAFEKSTIVISDPTLADKFVGSSTESVGRHEVNVIKELGTQNNGSKFVHDESDKSGLTVGDKWPRAGEPYIVPQMTEYERNLKVKRFQQPKNGVNNGH
ncbi:hypothetical protein ACUOJG_18145, partial [Escherichia coli]